MAPATPDSGPPIPRTGLFDRFRFEPDHPYWADVPMLAVNTKGKDKGKHVVLRGTVSAETLADLDEFGFWRFDGMARGLLQNPDFPLEYDLVAPGDTPLDLRACFTSELFKDLLVGVRDIASYARLLREHAALVVRAADLGYEVIDVGLTTVTFGKTLPAR